MRRGNCYVTCEALYHLLGGKKMGYKPMTVRHEGDVHWFLVRDVVVNGMLPVGDSREARIVIDPTASQFKTPVPYHRARGRGFLTKEPSMRARQLMNIMVWQEVS